ncbi:MAG TPA: GNAT family N-acetyltransferase [Baekduia sp.]|nr:GNAT family N-acetyltransferase [Baekduia sp.]
MPDDVTIRRLQPEDVPAASAVARAALDEQIPVEFMPSDDAARALTQQRMERRMEHCRANDPEGSWVAEAGGEVVGVALAIVREGVWGLSLFGVAPGRQGQGVGRRLLDASLRCAEGCRGAIILSTTDPRAMRRYFRAGFRTKPCLTAAGPINRSLLPANLRSRRGDVGADRELLDAASRQVRGAAHGRDVAAMLATGGRLLVLDDRGFAVHRDGSPVVVAAFDDEAARDLLWSCFADGPAGETVHVDFISDGNDWAIDVALEMGLSLGPDGPVFVRGETGPFAPYLPSGAYL